MAARDAPVPSDVRVIFVHWTATNIQIHNQILDTWKFNVVSWRDLRNDTNQLIDPTGTESELFDALINRIGADFDDEGRTGLKIMNEREDFITYDIMAIKQLGGIFMVKIQDKGAFLDSGGWGKSIRKPLFNVTNFIVDEGPYWGTGPGRTHARSNRGIERKIKTLAEKERQLKEREAELKKLEDTLIRKGQQKAYEEHHDYYADLHDTGLEQELIKHKREVRHLRNKIKQQEQQEQHKPKKARGEDVLDKSQTLDGSPGRSTSSETSPSLLDLLSGTF